MTTGLVRAPLELCLVKYLPKKTLLKTLPRKLSKEEDPHAEQEAMDKEAVLYIRMGVLKGRE